MPETGAACSPAAPRWSSRWPIPPSARASPTTPASWSGEEDRLYGEWVDLALALGITRRHVPDGPAAFRDYFTAMVNDRLECNDTVRLLIDLDHRPLPPPPRWPFPVSAWSGVALPPTVLLRKVGIGSLPPVLRERCGLRWTAADERRFRHFARAMRLADTVMIDRLRTSPIAARAMRTSRPGP
ncbi:hypothetical protein GCM10023085_14060 [Actinomadura viridis]|uniref:Uncharacterized protein (DUF2236 family) n=1 Tax=Actinomadura viridis TaxID=58110 RepID=A0A931DS56_9ACTN|nr:oxygenase MpaB family protein [Actinomadura viridis]MBG6093778.1 uncharacterized protein (DUF2236 family) [Actinomadura viridis]